MKIRNSYKIALSLSVGAAFFTLSSVAPSFAASSSTTVSSTVSMKTSAQMGEKQDKSSQHTEEHSIQIENAWARPMFPTAKVGAGYFEIMNNSAKDIRLTAINSNVAEKVELHSMQMEDNVMKMRHLEDGVEIGAHGGLSFKPGSYHVMFINPKAPFKAGEKFETEFVFDNGEKVKVPFSVKAPAKKMKMDHDHNKHARDNHDHMDKNQH